MPSECNSVIICKSCLNGYTPLVMPKNRLGPAGAYKLCHTWLKDSKLKLEQLDLLEACLHL